MLRIIESKLQEEINSLELRNLEVMENVYNCHRQELERAHKLFSIPGRHSTPIKMVVQCLVCIPPLKTHHKARYNVILYCIITIIQYYIKTM